MSGGLRLFVLLLAVAAIGLGCYDIANPYRFGELGFDLKMANLRDSTVTRIHPGSPAQHAGLRVGDLVVWSRMSPRSYFDVKNRRANQLVILPVQRGGKVIELPILTAQYVSAKPIEEGPLALVVLAIFAATGALVALRATRRREAALLALFLSIYALDMGTAWLWDVASAPAITFVAGIVTQVLNLIFFYILLLFIVRFPPIISPLRAAIERLALPLMTLLAVLYAWGNIADYIPAARMFHIAESSAPWWFDTLLWTIANLLLVAGAIEGLIRVDEEHRAQMRWVGGAIIVSTIGYIVLNLAILTNVTLPGTQWVSLLGDVPLLAISYAILRHRLVDLSIVVSRAAIFGFVSLIVVTLFLSLEWATSQILERTLGGAAAGGALGQALRLAIALAVGLSARPIHSLVERHLNRVFFGKRAQALAAMRRFALEADLVTDADALLSLTQETLDKSVEGAWSAVYMLRDGQTFERAGKSAEAPARLSENDSRVLRLRRWTQSFEAEQTSDSLSEALFVPMIVSGELIGLIVCGAKRERTHYLHEEFEALEQLAHRVGIAYLLLQHRNQSFHEAHSPERVLRLKAT